MEVIRLLYENPAYKKAKGSRRIIVACAHCKTHIALYEKVGPGGLLRIYLSRIVKSSVVLSEKGLFCPDCGRQLGAKGTLKRKKTEAYRLIRGSFHVLECK